MRGGAQPSTFLPSRLHSLLADGGEGEGGIAPPHDRHPPPVCAQQCDAHEAGALAHTAAQPGAQHLVAVFDTPLRGLAPQQAIVLYELSEEGGSGDPWAEAMHPLLVAGQDTSKGSPLEGAWVRVGCSMGDNEGRTGVGLPARAGPSRSLEDSEGKMGPARTACGHKGQPADLSCTRTCLGSSVLLVPGLTVYEEQLNTLHRP